MGLDMYAFRVAKNFALGDFEIAGLEHGVRHEEIMYWRKHHDLHGWMERLYRAKGGDKPSFNCIPVRLTIEDLNALEADILANKLPVTQGFFFGVNPPDEDSKLQDMEFIGMAKIVISEGDEVYYDSWW